MLQLLSLAHGFAAPQPFSGPFWNLASQATGPWDQYWWLFDWRDGGKSTCAPGHAKYQMAFVSRAEKDGAYGDDHSASIEIYKQAACTYWYLDNDQVLRWYAKGYDAPAAALTNISAGTRFLAFDGWSQWKRDPTSTLTLSDGKRRFDLAGAGMSSGMGPEAWVYGTRCDQATRKVPTYMTVPDAPVTADVIVSRKNPAATVDDANHNCGVGSEAAFDSPNWAAACTFVPDWQWAAIYRSGGNWSGGQKLQYVGYSETADGDASAVGACEEWWFAEGLGVVAIAKFPMLTYAGCRAVLAGTAPRGRPDSPDAQFAAYGDQMAGMAVLVDSCADDPTQCEACAWPGGGRGAGGECIGRK